MLNIIVTLKAGLEVTRCHSVDGVRVPIGVPKLWPCLVSFPGCSHILVENYVGGMKILEYGRPIVITFIRLYHNVEKRTFYVQPF